MDLIASNVTIVYFVNSVIMDIMLMKADAIKTIVLQLVLLVPSPLLINAINAKTTVKHAHRMRVYAPNALKTISYMKEIVFRIVLQLFFKILVLPFNSVLGVNLIVKSV